MPAKAAKAVELTRLALPSTGRVWPNLIRGENRFPMQIRDIAYFDGPTRLSGYLAMEAGAPAAGRACSSSMKDWGSVTLPWSVAAG
jgi:hypothetical protein